MHKITLRYFEAVGRAQPIRHALLDAGVVFEDVRATLEDWPSLREDPLFGGPFHALPTLTWDEATIGETLPIASFIAKKLSHYEGLSDAEIAAHEGVVSHCYLEVLVRIGELIWSDLMYAGADFAKSVQMLMPRMLDKLACVENQYRGAFFGGKRPIMTDFFAAEAIEVATYAFGNRREAALRRRLPRLFDLAEAVAERPAVAGARKRRPPSFTMRPDEAAVVARLSDAALFLD